MGGVDVTETAAGGGTIGRQAGSPGAETGSASAEAGSARAEKAGERGRRDEPVAEGAEAAGRPSGLRARITGLDRHWLGIGAMAALAALCYALYAYLRFRQGSYFGWDLGIFDQTVRDYAHFHLPYVTSMRHNSPTDPGKLEWTDHFSPILMLLAPLYWVSNSA